MVHLFEINQINIKETQKPKLKSIQEKTNQNQSQIR